MTQLKPGKYQGLVRAASRLLAKAYTRISCMSSFGRELAVHARDAAPAWLNSVRRCSATFGHLAQSKTAANE
jgi:hypothetical protein